MPLIERHEAEAPNEPVLVVCLEGWIDAGLAAATATASLVEAIAPVPYATFSGDDLVDQRARRPRLRIDDGVRGEIAFSEPAVLVGADPLGAGVAFLIGPEPDYRWRAFADEVAELAEELEVRLVVGLGAFPTGVPHTRPVRLAATASDSTLARQVGFVAGSIDVPAGVGEVVGAACTAVGIPSVGLWARVPHYVSGMPYAPGALALVEGLAALSGLVVDTDELRASAEVTRRRVDTLIAESEEHAALVRRLEEQSDDGFEEGGVLGDLQGGEPLPSGDELAAELERYLRGDG
ncbi:MAG: hypothetical protein JWM85_25 [Acidimicrobiaceae bacterium]|nr:hypothetical protein [Acidimicrobiaceae bacterium]